MGKFKDYRPKTKFRFKVYSRYDLAYVRESLGLTLDDVGKVLGCNKRNLSDLENGRLRVGTPMQILYGIALEEICKERGLTFEQVVNSTEYFIKVV